MKLANIQNTILTSTTVASAEQEKDDVNQRQTKRTTITMSAPKRLATFQREFGQFLRQHSPNTGDKSLADKNLTPKSLDSQNLDQQHTPQTFNQMSKSTQLYQKLVFNNISGFLNRCFPVCKSLLTAQKWQWVCQQFICQHGCHSPYFSEINHSFVEFLAQPNQLQRLSLPSYFAELAHYEWVELLVDTLPNATTSNKSAGDENISLTVNHTLQNLHYTWAVHQISASMQPTAPEDSFFLIFRHQGRVQFIKANAMTHALVAYLQQTLPITTSHEVKQEAVNQLLINFAHLIHFDNPQEMVEFGMILLEQFLAQGVLYQHMVE